MAEHVFWERPAWKEHRRRYLPLLARLTGPVGPNLTRPLGLFSRWPKWVRSTGLVPNDNELDEQNLVLREGEEEVWRRPGGEHSENLHYNEVGQVVVHTDGGCTNPEYRRLRRATYGISYGEGHKWNRAEALRGVEQTAGRAELRAALGAFEWAEEPTEVTSDNDWVVKGTYAIIMGGGNPQDAYQDLWVRMRGAINRLGPGGSAIRWTKGHATQQHIDEGVFHLGRPGGK